MLRRTTIELDEDLLERAKRVLGQDTMRGTVEEALRRATAEAERDEVERATKQRTLLRELSELLDLSVLASDDMWR